MRTSLVRFVVVSVLALFVLAACADGLVQPTSPTGTKIEAATIEDYCFRVEPVVTHIKGDKDLQRVAVLADKHHVLGLKGIRESSVYDGCRSSIVLKIDGETREIGVLNCKDTQLCPFLEELHEVGLTPTAPRGCHMGPACEAK